MTGSATAPQSTSLLGLLDQLAEPVPPPPVSMFPATWGWLVLALILAALLLYLLLRGVLRWRANAYRRTALRELSRSGGDPVAVAGLLRRTALAVWPREQVAALTGQQWLAFLDASAEVRGFVDGPGSVLITAPYHRQAQASVPGLEQLATQWLRTHRRTLPAGDG